MPESSEYEAPRIESVLHSEDLEREVAYAGGSASVYSQPGEGREEAASGFGRAEAARDLTRLRQACKKLSGTRGAKVQVAKPCNMVIPSLIRQESRLHEPSDYEAPRIESVLHSEDLEREVAYAGTPPSGSPG